MNCPDCDGRLRKPTSEELSKSLLIFYAQATHICKTCGKMWTIHEITIPLYLQSKRKGMEAYL